VDNKFENQFDGLDLRIIEALSKDARIPFSQLAKQLNVSNSFIHQRFRKIKESGVLTAAVYLIDPISLGYETCAYTQIILSNARHHERVEEELKKIPEIVECVNIAGRYAVMVKIYAVNNRHLRDIIYEKIQPIEGVEETNTVVSFETSFNRNVPIPK
jgi:Lrp/AsnC family transcriptional regulator for asnA, asnC and gidA